MARTRPGSDLRARSVRRLCHRHLGHLGVCAGEERPEDVDEEGEEEAEEEEEWLGEPALALLVAAAAERRVTVRSVLKYSLSWVITPSGPTVQACTQ